MVEDAGRSWEQPGFENTREATAVQLITAAVQEVFTALDPDALVDRSVPHLPKHERRAIAELIDNAVVEIVVDFG